MIDWPWVVFGYLGFGTMAFYLQYRYSLTALDKVAAAHDRNVADLHLMIEVLQLALLHEQEIKAARINRVTHADFGALPPFDALPPSDEPSDVDTKWQTSKPGVEQSKLDTKRQTPKDFSEGPIGE